MEFTSPSRVICPVCLRIRKILADFKVVETSNQDDRGTVGKIKGIRLTGEEAWGFCRQCVSERPDLTDWKGFFFLLGFCPRVGVKSDFGGMVASCFVALT